MSSSSKQKQQNIKYSVLVFALPSVFIFSLLWELLCVNLCVYSCINHIMCERREEKDKSPDTFLICSFI